MSHRIGYRVFAKQFAWRYGENPRCHTCGKPVNFGQKVVTQYNTGFGHGKLRHQACYERLLQ